MAKPGLQPGSTMDGFHIEELIHRGGMARLWSVSKPGIDMPLLMKVPILGEGGDPAAIVSFEMEQMIMARISGPHVPQFVAAGDFAVHPYIVMERLAGKSLLPRLANLPLPYEEVAEIGWKVATALEDLHRQHVIHLDIKPSNILFRPSGEAVLIDFGLSRHTQLPDLMQEEFRLPYGTAPYMAPEQLLGVRHDPRSDQFAPRRSALLLFDRRTPVWRQRALERHEEAALARSQAAEGSAARLSAVAAGNRAALPRSRAGMALSHRGAACLRAKQPRSDQADGPVRAAEARFLFHRHEAAFQPGPEEGLDAAHRGHAASGRRRLSRLPSISPRRPSHQRGAARSRGTRAGDAAGRPACLPQCAETELHLPPATRCSTRTVTTSM